MRTLGAFTRILKRLPALRTPPEPEDRYTRHLEKAAARVVRIGWGSLHRDEQPLLKELVEATNDHPGPIIEVGTLLGETTTLLALWSTGQRKIITLDNYSWNPWLYSARDHEALTRQMLAYLIHTGRVELVSGDKNAFYAQYRGPAPSLVFLDASHEYDETKKDIEWARRVGAAVIAGHDYVADFPGVIRVVDEFGGPRRLLRSVWCL